MNKDDYEVVQRDGMEKPFFIRNRKTGKTVIVNHGGENLDGFYTRKHANNALKYGVIK